MTAPILAITSGEPAGIGPDICLDLAFADLPCRPVVLCDKNLLVNRAEQLGKSVILRDFQAQAAEPLPKGELEVLHIPLDAECRAGELNPANAAYVLRLLDTAYQGISDGLFAGMVTAPLHKGIINDAHADNGFFSGHTEYLAEKSHTEQVVMMLTGGGLLGHEEIDTIIPALHALQAEGIDARGPYPADTVFQPFLLKDADAVLAMYHDQGLPVLKYAGFGEGVNITLGLPFIRTSVDHGTALNLAGTGKADSGSLITAVRAALDMSHNMQKQAV